MNAVQSYDNPQWDYVFLTTDYRSLSACCDCIPSVGLHDIFTIAYREYIGGMRAGRAARLSFVWLYWPDPSALEIEVIFKLETLRLAILGFGRDERSCAATTIRPLLVLNVADQVRSWTAAKSADAALFRANSSCGARLAATSSTCVGQIM